MYLHIGGDVLIPKSRLIAIIDLDTAGNAIASKEFMQIAELEGLLKSFKKEGKPKSCIITDHMVYLSTISSTTLMKRAQEDIFCSQ
ncbi:MAG: extracellular matrix regulator RemB [Bacillota bacterium]